MRNNGSVVKAEELLEAYESCTDNDGISFFFLFFFIFFILFFNE